MKLIRSISLFVLLSIICCTGYAQKQTFDAVSYLVPAGWQQKQNAGSVQLLATDNKVGAYIMVIITNAAPSTASAIENFNNKWKAAIKDQIQLDGEPAMQPSSSKNGWDIETGSAGYTDNGGKGSVALLSATGGGQTVSVVIMFNTKQYEKELAAFLTSLELVKVAQKETGNTSPAGKSSVVGLWCDYMLETRGNNINGTPQYTSGYFRKEYAFYADGTYLFRNKQWLTKAANILFIYESGTYEVHGNQLTIKPKIGKSGYWSKTSSTKEWGKPVKTSDHKLEGITYAFDIKYFSTSDSYSLYLNSGKPTERDGGQFNSANDPFEFHYFLRKLESLIDNPPGFKTGFENKPLTSSDTH